MPITIQMQAIIDSANTFIQQPNDENYQSFEVAVKDTSPMALDDASISSILESLQDTGGYKHVVAASIYIHAKNYAGMRQHINALNQVDNLRSYAYSLVGNAMINRYATHIDIGAELLESLGVPSAESCESSYFYCFAKYVSLNQSSFLGWRDFAWAFFSSQGIIGDDLASVLGLLPLEMKQALNLPSTEDTKELSAYCSAKSLALNENRFFSWRMLGEAFAQGANLSVIPYEIRQKLNLPSTEDKYELTAYCSAKSLALNENSFFSWRMLGEAFAQGANLSVIPYETRQKLSLPSTEDKYELSAYCSAKSLALNENYYSSWGELGEAFVNGANLSVIPLEVRQKLKLPNISSNHGLTAYCAAKVLALTEDYAWAWSLLATAFQDGALRNHVDNDSAKKLGLPLSTNNQELKAYCSTRALLIHENDNIAWYRLGQCFKQGVQRNKIPAALALPNHQNQYALSAFCFAKSLNTDANRSHAWQNLGFTFFCGAKLSDIPLGIRRGIKLPDFENKAALLAFCTAKTLLLDGTQATFWYNLAFAFHQGAKLSDIPSGARQKLKLPITDSQLKLAAFCAEKAIEADYTFENSWSLLASILSSVTDKQERDLMLASIRKKINLPALQTLVESNSNFNGKDLARSAYHSKRCMQLTEELKGIGKQDASQLVDFSQKFTRLTSEAYTSAKTGKYFSPIILTQLVYLYSEASKAPGVREALCAYYQGADSESSTNFATGLINNVTGLSGVCYFLQFLPQLINDNSPAVTEQQEMTCRFASIHHVKTLIEQKQGELGATLESSYNKPDTKKRSRSSGIIDDTSATSTTAATSSTLVGNPAVSDMSIDNRHTLFKGTVQGGASPALKRRKLTDGKEESNPDSANGQPASSSSHSSGDAMVEDVGRGLK